MNQQLNSNKFISVGSYQLEDHMNKINCDVIQEYFYVLNLNI